MPTIQQYCADAHWRAYKAKRTGEKLAAPKQPERHPTPAAPRTAARSPVQPAELAVALNR